MRKMNICKCITACVLTLLLACPFTAMAQQAVNTEWWVPVNQIFRPEELDQMLAPIALYPDALLAQVLAAATYPQSIVSADRFVKDNPRVPIQTLLDVARDTDWSPSVKAMLLFPDILTMMDQRLDWTTKLGDAFLAQQRDMMDSVQRLRYMAYQQGRLVTTRESVVRFDPQTQTIFIEPANSQMVYVPVYDSGIVYGTWRYPDYPPYRYDYPGYSNSSAFSFLAGIVVGAALGWGGWDFDWDHHRSNVRVDNYNNFVSHSYTSPDRYRISSSSGGVVAYDTHFRTAAGYSNYATAQRFSGQQASGPTTRQSVSGPRGVEQVQTRASVSTVGEADVSAKNIPASRTNLKGGASNTRQTASSSVTPAVVSTGNQQASKTKLKNIPEPRAVASSPVVKASKPTENISAFSDVGSGGSVRAASVRGQSSLKSSRSVGISQVKGVSRGSSVASKGGSGKVSQTGNVSNNNAKSADESAIKSAGSKGEKEKR